MLSEAHILLFYDLKYPCLGNVKTTTPLETCNSYYIFLCAYHSGYLTLATELGYILSTCLLAG